MPCFPRRAWGNRGHAALAMLFLDIESRALRTKMRKSNIKGPCPAYHMAGRPRPPGIPGFAAVDYERIGPLQVSACASLRWGRGAVVLY